MIFRHFYPLILPSKPGQALKGKWLKRGANENTQGLIRQYFPKGTDFANVTQKQTDYVQYKLNNRSGKRPGFFSPIEFFNKFVESKHKQQVTLQLEYSS